MSALPQKADIGRTHWDVRFVPKGTHTLHNSDGVIWPAAKNRSSYAASAKLSTPADCSCFGVLPVQRLQA
jgi:hypothetical protein